MVSYTIVAEARGQEPLFFREFGSYQGEWIMLARDDENYIIYRGSYGSCSGCDSLQAEFDYTDDDEKNADTFLQSKKVQDFIKDYAPFLEVDHMAAQRLARRAGTLLELTPANRRDWIDEDMPADRVGRQFALIVLHREGGITAREILEIDNTETRRAAFEKYGPEIFFDNLMGQVIDVDGDDRLVHVPIPTPVLNGDTMFAFLYLKDASTPRRYILRTDPKHETVLAARAASFGMRPEQFVLVQET